MKTFVFAIAMLTLATATVVGQSKEIVDDIYFKPSDVVKQTERPIAKQPVYKNGAKEIVFIEHGQKVEIVTPDTTVLLGEANDSSEQETEEGYYLNGFNGSQSDMEYASRIRKFHNPKYRVFIGDPAYNDIYFVNNFDWNVYVEDNYAYVTPTWTNPYWFDYSFRPYSSWGWNSWSYGYPSYSNYYGMGNYPWSYNNYWGGYGGYYGGMYGSYYGSMYGYGMGYPYYGYGYSPYDYGFYNGYYYGSNYGSNYGNSTNLINRSTGSGTRQISNSRTTIGGGGTFRDASAVRSNTNYTAVGGSSRSVLNPTGSRSIRSAADFQNRTFTGSTTNRTTTERNTNAIVNSGNRQTGIRTNETNYRSTSSFSTSTAPRTSSAITTRESGVRSTYTAPRVSTAPRTGNSVQSNPGVRSSYSTGNTTRSSYSTGTPSVTRESRSTYSASPSTSTRSTYNSSSSSSSGSSYRSTPSYNSGSSSSSSSSNSSSSGSSSDGGRR